MILSTIVYIDTNTFEHVVSVRLTSSPSHVDVRDHGGSWKRVSFTRSGDVYTLRHTPLHKECFYVRFNTEDAITLDTVFETFVEYNKTSGDLEERKREYENTGGPGHYDEENGMVDLTDLGELRVPLPDFNTVKIEIQLRGDLAEVEYPRYMDEQVYSFTRGLPYEIDTIYNGTPYLTFGELTHPSTVFQLISPAGTEDPFYMVENNSSSAYDSFGFLWNRLYRDNYKLSYRMIARNLSPVPIGSDFLYSLMIDEELYNFDYYCDFGG